MLKRPCAASSLTKNSRRHGAGNDTSSMRWMASTSPMAAGSMSRSSIRLLLRLLLPQLLLSQLNLGLGQPHVNRRDVAMAIPLTARLDGLGAARTAGRQG